MWQRDLCLGCSSLVGIFCPVHERKSIGIIEGWKIAEKKTGFLNSLNCKFIVQFFVLFLDNSINNIKTRFNVH